MDSLTQDFVCLCDQAIQEANELMTQARAGTLPTAVVEGVAKVFLQIVERYRQAAIDGKLPPSTPGAGIGLTRGISDTGLPEVSDAGLRFYRACGKIEEFYEQRM